MAGRYRVRRLLHDTKIVRCHDRRCTEAGRRRRTTIRIATGPHVRAIIAGRAVADTETQTRTRTDLTRSEKVTRTGVTTKSRVK